MGSSCLGAKILLWVGLLSLCFKLDTDLYLVHARTPTKCEYAGGFDFNVIKEDVTFCLHARFVQNVSTTCTDYSLLWANLFPVLFL